MNFNIKNEGYDPHQVDAYIKEITGKYEEIIYKMKILTERLRIQNAEKDNVIKKLKAENELFLGNGEKPSTLDEIYAELLSGFNSEIQSLKNFEKSWSAFASEVKDKLDEETSKKLSNIDIISKGILNNLGDKVEKFNETDNYINHFEGTEEQFDYNEAMHPIESLEDMLASFDLNNDTKK